MEGCGSCWVLDGDSWGPRGPQGSWQSWESEEQGREGRSRAETRRASAEEARELASASLCALSPFLLDILSLPEPQSP